jgi:hypothetical protein
MNTAVDAALLIKFITSSQNIRADQFYLQTVGWQALCHGAHNTPGLRLPARRAVGTLAA